MSVGNQKDLYFVAVKLFLRRGNELLITHDIFGSWDLPGGRIRANEFDVPLESVIVRKINEELGKDIKFDVEDPIIFFRVERLENSLGKSVRIFAVGYEAKYISGEVHLGDHHDAFEWVNVNKFQPKKYFFGGWLKGVEEYLDKVN